MGLSVAAGMALGNRNKKVYVLLSDGEMQEGNTFEAALMRQHKLKIYTRFATIINIKHWAKLKIFWI